MSDIEEPPIKKLCGRKVTFVLRYQDKSGQQEVTYEEDGYDIAKFSNILKDTLNCEDSQETSIVLEGLKPEVFELAMKFVEDISAAHSMTFLDAMRVLEFYCKYDFHRALHLCDNVLNKFITSHSLSNYTTPLGDIDMLVNVMEAADKYHLEKSKKSSIAFIASRFKADAIKSLPHLTAIIFTAEHLEKLKPLMRKMSHADLAKSLLNKYTEEDWESWDFSEVCKRDVQDLYIKGRANPPLDEQAFILTGSLCADGRFDSGRLGRWVKLEEIIDGTSTYTVEGGNGKSWAILWKPGRSSKPVKLWSYDGGKESEYPPTEGWTAVHPSVEGSYPKIQFIKRF